MKLYRYKQTKTSVFGILKDDKGGTYFTLENASALIPCGTYKVCMHDSPTFKGYRPHLVNDALGVGAARYILMHEGNLYTDSKGCILVGNRASLVGMTLEDSKAAVAQLVRNCGTTIEIVDICSNVK